MTSTPFLHDKTSTVPSQVSIWHGNLSDIPNGWLLADGNNGTPDLRDKFIKGPSSYPDGPGASGGNTSISLSTGQLPSHDHTGETYSSGGHSHNINANGLDSGGLNTPYYTSPSGDYSTGTTSNGSHSHSTGSSNSTGSGNGIDNRPSYYEVAFIVKL